MSNLLSFSPIRIEWNAYNGFIAEVFHVESCWPNMDSALFGISFSKAYFYVDLFYFTIKVFDKTGL